VATGTYSSII